MAANADAHFDPKVLSFLQDTSSIVPHRDSGSARALEKSGELGKHNVSMYIQLRMTMWTLLTLRGNMWGLLNRDQHAAGQPAIQAADRLPRPVPVKYNSGRNRATPFMIIDIPTAKAAVYRQPDLPGRLDCRWHRRGGQALSRLRRPLHRHRLCRPAVSGHPRHERRGTVGR